MSSKPNVLPVSTDRVPELLRAEARWVLWKYEFRGDGWRKVPKTVSGSNASSTNSDTWATFDQVVTEYVLGETDADGIGFVLGDGWQGLDLDDRVVDGVLDGACSDAVASVPGYWEISPSGAGVKGIFRASVAAAATRKEIGIEFYPSGRYFAVTGRALTDQLTLDDRTAEITGWLERHLPDVEVEREDQFAPEPTGDEALDDWLRYDYLRRLEKRDAPRDGWPLERVVEEVLPHLGPEWFAYDDWLRVGQALHHQGNGGLDWLAAWDEWSAAGPGYEPEACELKWDSFSERRGGARVVTLGTLLHATKDARRPIEEAKQEAKQEEQRDQRRQHLDMLRAGIAGCQDDQALKDYCKNTIATDDLIDDVDREGVLVPAVEQRYAQLTGNRLKRDLARLMVRRSSPPPSGGGGPGWLGDWAYVTDLDGFFNLKTKAKVSPRGFDALHSADMPLAQDGIHRERASDYSVHVWSIRTVDNVLYAPGQPTLFEALGVRWGNLYKEDSVPVSAPYEGASGAVEMVKSHLARLIPEDRERSLLISWLAHNVRHPGRKIRWAPYLFGPQGTGKTFIAELLSMVMGGANVRVVSGSTLQSPFNSWATGAAVVAVEEVYQVGHMLDIEEKLKAPISNNVVDIHRKGKDAYAAPNFTNYLLLSNHADGMPVSEGDRRFFFVRVALTADQAKALAAEGYFDSLFDSCRAAPGQLRSWLESCELHPEFDPQGRAPETVARAEVIEISKPDYQVAFEGLVEGVSAVSGPGVAAALRAAGADVPRGRAFNGMLQKAGFELLKKVRFGKTMARVYARPAARGWGDDALRKECERLADTADWPDAD